MASESEIRKDVREQAQELTGQFERRKISSILVVINQDNGRKAVDECLQLIESGIKNPEVYLFYVVDMDPVAPLVNGSEKMYSELRKKGSEVIDKEVKRLRDRGVELEVFPPHFGIAAEAILRTEKSVQPDLIIMDARGLSTLKKLFMGSISDTVSKKAKAPVLIANGKVTS